MTMLFVEQPGSANYLSQSLILSGNVFRTPSLPSSKSYGAAIVIELKG